MIPKPQMHVPNVGQRRLDRDDATSRTAFLPQTATDCGDETLAHSRRIQFQLARRLGAIAIAMTASLFVGCGGDLGLTPVTGTVTLDGKPLPNAEVVFRPEDGRPSLGTTDDQGRFELRYSSDQMGAVQGKHKVSISTRGDQSAESGVPELVPARYNAQTTLEQEVQAGQQPLTFDLQSKP